MRIMISCGEASGDLYAGALTRELRARVPFEGPLCERAGVPAQFVGHPLVAPARATQSRPELLRAHSLDPERPTVALLPGSRPNEIRRIAPVIVEALPLIRARVPN